MTPMSIRALIVDDENLARKRIRKLLAPEADIEIIGECADGPQAIRCICEQRPDLVFLDVQMPEVTGFDVLRALPPQAWPEVIFVTAHDSHALEAFEVQAVDYLLKPFTQARLHEAVRRVVQRVQTRASAAIDHQLVELLNASPARPPRLQRMAVRTGSRTVLVKVEDIDYFESAANYVVAHTSTENHVLRKPLAHLEAELPPRRFVRISRSTIVNINRIKEFRPGPEGESLIVLHDGKELAMTRGVREVQELLLYS
jgi:two-component system, LytTR family, response regulator